MTTAHLDAFFAPRSLAVVLPASPDPILLNLLFSRLATPEALRHHALTLIGKEVPESASEIPHVVQVTDLATAPDLILYLADPEGAPNLISEAGKRGTRAVALLAASYDFWSETLVSECLQAARPFQLRLIGPGSLGVGAPHVQLDALLSASAPEKGDLAFITRSSAITNATLAWAGSHGIGFSGIASLGQKADVDVGDLIDYFANDYRTRAILVHLEAISSPRKFLSAARAAARSKPLVLIRSGRSRDVTGSGKTHASRLTVPDLVYDAALRRAGILRVEDTGEMFEAVETLSRTRGASARGRLALISNSHSLATLALDQLEARGGRLAAFSPSTCEALAPFARPQATAENPLTLKEDCSGDALAQAMAAALADPETDGLVVLSSPTALCSAESSAEAIAKAAQADKRRTGRKKPIIADIMGATPLPRAALDTAQVPCYSNPAGAIRSFMHLTRNAQAQDLLMAVPPSLPTDFTPQADLVRTIVRKALDEGRSWLGPDETWQVLSAYDIPAIETHLVQSAEAAAKVAEVLLARHGRCVVKAHSPDLPFKSDINGVLLGLDTVEEVKRAAHHLLTLLPTAFPEARFLGVTIQPMLDDHNRTELYMGLSDDPVFGPVLVFGQGGTAVEVTADVAMELPPLDLNLARALIDRTRVSKLLDAFRGRPAKERAAVALTLVKLSQIAVDIPEILELDINPLAATSDRLMALDARIILGKPKVHPGRRGTSRLAIMPYPQEWEQTLDLKDGWQVFVRPMRPEDEGLLKAFFETISLDDLRLRFFAPVKEFSHRFLVRLTQLDYARAMAFAAFDKETSELIGAVRLHADPDHTTGEYAIMVRSDLKGRGLGWALMKLIIRYAKADGISTIKGEVLRENSSMLAMCEALGFSAAPSPDDASISVVTLPVSGMPEEHNFPDHNGED